MRTVDDLGLGDDQARALGAIIGGRLAWSMARDLREAGHAPGTLLALEAAGWVERWEPPKGELAWCLSALALLTLGLVVVEVGPDEEPRYGYPGDVRPWVRVRREKGHGALAFPEEVVDRAPGPELMIDPADGEPLLLFGRTVVIDERIRKLTKAAKRKHARASAAKGKTRRAKASWSRAGRRSP